MSRKTFEIRQEREIYSLEIIKLLSGKKNSILIKTFNKKTTPKIIYTNNFSYNKLIELSKAFKTCDSISEIFNLISNNLENKSIKILLSNNNKNIEICFDFNLPNGKTEEIKLTLEEVKGIKSSLEKFSQQLNLLEQKNKILEKQLNYMKSENEKLKNNINKNKNDNNNNINENNIKKEKEINLFELMSEIFCISKYKLSQDLKNHLFDFGLKKEYGKQLHKKFTSKIKKIYDIKTDGDSLVSFMTKVFGKKNLVSFHSLSNKDEYINVQISYLNGIFEFVNNYFNFQNCELFTYGDYQSFDDGYCFTSFRAQNSKLYAKIESDCIYIIFYEHGNINFIIKIRENFAKNPILYINDNLRKIEEFFKNNKEDKVFELFEKYKSKELNLTDLAIYQIVDE